MATQTPLTNSNIQSAVNDWISDPTQAIFTNNVSSQSPYYGQINTWNTTAVTDMSNLFLNKTTFTDDISDWDVSNVTTMANMFKGATSFNINIKSSSSDGWTTSSLTDMSGMFHGATSFNQRIWDMDVSNVTTMESCFEGATSYNQLLLLRWNVINVTNMKNMFKDATSYGQKLDNWATDNVTTMEGMFRNCNVNFDMKRWHLQSIENMSYMFAGATIAKSISALNNWNSSSYLSVNLSDISYMFTGATAHKIVRIYQDWAEFFLYNMRLDALTTVKGYLQNATFNHTSVTVNIVDLRMNLNRTCPLLTDFSFMFADVY